MCEKVTEEILDIFFEKYSQVEGAAMRAKYKQPGMVKYFSALIHECSRGEDCDPQNTCRDVVVAILRYHEKSKKNNGGVCMKGKYHDVLNVAIKLCYDWQLRDNPTVAAVLNQIYLCEKSFDSIWVGALIGIEERSFGSRWINDYKDQEDNFRAVFYLLDHATNAKLEYPNANGEMIRYINVPFKTSSFTPLTMVLLYGLPDKAYTMLRFGATFDKFIVHILYNRLIDNQPSYPYNFVGCFKLILRSSNKSLIHLRNENSERFYNLIEGCSIPLQRCGVEPSDLKHLCRCSIRKMLRQNYQLPYGIKKLEIPVILHKYLDLLIN